MKRYKIHLIPLLAMLPLLFAACDKVDEPLVVVSVQNIPDQIPDTLFFSDSVASVEKHVLFEEFTGHKCVNCAEASLSIHDLAEQLDHRLIIYGIHAGFYAQTDPEPPYNIDHTCPDGNEIFQHFQEPFNPTATVDRKAFSGNVIVFPNNWEAAVTEAIQEPSPVSLKLKNSWYPNQQKVLIEATVEVTNDITAPCKLVVAIAEDHVIAAQKNNNPSVGPSPDWLDYDHRNILRDVITPVFGSPLTGDGTLATGETYTATWFYAPDEAWITGNCNIIAYLLNDETGEVIQAVELGIPVE